MHTHKLHMSTVGGDGPTKTPGHTEPIHTPAPIVPDSTVGGDGPTKTGG
jgi:hypothetical protein